MRLAAPAHARPPYFHATIWTLYRQLGSTDRSPYWMSSPPQDGFIPGRSRGSRTRSKRRRFRWDFAQLPSTCRDCGASLEDRRRRYCDNCRAERFADRAPAGRQRAAEVLAQLRTEQRDPAHGGRAPEIRGAKNAAHQAAVRDWRGERPDPEVFRTEILPELRRVPIGELMASTGLSEHYCSLIRLGKKTPHPRHWDALRGVSDDARRSMVVG
jgi:hypothetical protein